MKLKKILSLFMVLIMCFVYTACSSDKGTNEPVVNNDAKTDATEDNKQQDDNKKEKVTLKYFSPKTNRETGEGHIEQTMIDTYMKLHPEVEIKVETVGGGDAYKQKLNSYVVANDIPDIYFIWGQPQFFAPIMENGYALDLNEADFKDYGFFEGCLEGFKHDGKLYGLPTTSDVMVLYYNDQLFKDNNVKVPVTYEELLDACEKFNEAGITPIALPGKDAWVAGILYQNILQRLNGNNSDVYKAISKNPYDFSSDENYLLAAKKLNDMFETNVFQDSYISSDYGQAKNLFTSGEAAMYYMGSWEMGMKDDKGLDDTFKDNLQVMTLPAIKGGKGKSTDLISWNGGGVALSANTKHPEVARDFIKFMMSPENYAKMAWTNKYFMPAQKFKQFNDGTENDLQLAIVDILDSSTSVSGTPWFDAVSPIFKTDATAVIEELTAKIIEPEDFITKINEAIEKAHK